MSNTFEKLDLDHFNGPISGEKPFLSKKEQMDLIKNTRVSLEVRVGSGQISLHELFALKPGSIVSLDKKSVEGVELLLNGRVVGVGELIVVNDHFGIQIVQMADP